MPVALGPPTRRPIDPVDSASPESTVSLQFEPLPSARLRPAVLTVPFWSRSDAVTVPTPTMLGKPVTL